MGIIDLVFSEHVRCPGSHLLPGWRKNDENGAGTNVNNRCHNTHKHVIIRISNIDIL